MSVAPGGTSKGKVRETEREETGAPVEDGQEGEGDAEGDAEDEELVFSDDEVRLSMLCRVYVLRLTLLALLQFGMNQKQMAKEKEDLRVLLEHFDSTQMDRYEAYRRSGLTKGNVRKVSSCSARGRLTFLRLADSSPPFAARQPTTRSICFPRRHHRRPRFLQGLCGRDCRERCAVRFVFPSPFPFTHLCFTSQPAPSPTTLEDSPPPTCAKRTGSTKPSTREQEAEESLARRCLSSRLIGRRGLQVLLPRRRNHEPVRHFFARPDPLELLRVLLLLHFRRALVALDKAFAFRFCSSEGVGSESSGEKTTEQRRRIWRSQQHQRLQAW